MKNQLKRSEFEEALVDFLEKTKEKPILFEDLIDALAGKGRALLLLFLSIPFCLPIPIPGLSIPFGIVIALIGLRMLFNSPHLLPKFLLKKQISPEVASQITQKSLLVLRKVKPWLHPRLALICQNSLIKIFNALSIFLLGFLLALPLPIPFTNLAAAWPLFFITLGILEDDGLFILLGLFMTLLALLFFVGLFFSVDYYFHHH